MIAGTIALTIIRTNARSHKNHMYASTFAHADACKLFNAPTLKTKFPSKDAWNLTLQATKFACMFVTTPVCTPARTLIRTLAFTHTLTHKHGEENTLLSMLAFRHAPFLVGMVASTLA